MDREQTDSSGVGVMGGGVKQKRKRNHGHEKIVVIAGGKQVGRRGRGIKEINGDGKIQ